MRDCDPLGIVSEIQARRRPIEAQLAKRLPVPADPTQPYRDEIAALKRKIAQKDAEIAGKDSYISKLKAALDGEKDEAGRKCPTAVDVIEAYCAALKHVGVTIDGAAVYTPDDCMSPRRAHAYAHPRHVAMWLCRRLCKGLSLPRLGHIFRRDHTSVMHGVTKAAKRWESRPDLKAAALIVLAKYGAEGELT